MKLHKLLKMTAVSVLTFTSCATFAAHAYPFHHQKNKKVIVQKYPNGVIVKRVGQQITVIVPPELTKTDALTRRHELLTTGAGSPTASINAPNAFGPSHPTIFANAIYVNHWSVTHAEDGAGGFGFSVGNPHKNVGALVNIGLSSLGFNNDSFGSNGGIGLRLNRYIDPTTAFAIGVANLTGWGAQQNISSSFYTSLTKAFYLGVPVSANIGLGTGGYNSIADGTVGTDKNVFPFASLGFGLFKNFTALADWTTNQVNLGGNYIFTFIPKVPIFLGAYAMNVNQSQGTTYFQAAGGLAYSFV